MATTSAAEARSENEMTAGACDHAYAEQLGVGGSTMFFECACGVVLVASRGRVWAIPRRSA